MEVEFIIKKTKNTRKKKRKANKQNIFQQACKQSNKQCVTGGFFTSLGFKNQKVEGARD